MDGDELVNIAPLSIHHLIMAISRLTEVRRRDYVLLLSNDFKVVS